MDGADRRVASSVAVHMLGKVKTTCRWWRFRSCCIDGGLFGVIDTRLWGTWLIWVAAVLTVWSMVYYLQKAMPEIRAKAK
jgi:cardiolipin synthase